MKKQIICLLTILEFTTLGGVTTVYGQTNANDSTDQYAAAFCEMNINTSPKQHGITMSSGNILLGIHVWKPLSVLLEYQNTLGLYDKDGVRTYYRTNTAFGGGLSCNVYQEKAGKGIFEGRLGIDMRTLFSTTVGHPDWKYRQYNIEATFYDRMHKVYTPILGIGYRYVDSITEGMSNLSNVYVQVGICF